MGRNSAGGGVRESMRREVGRGLRINRKGGRRGKFQASGGEKVSSGYSWEGRNREREIWRTSTV